MVIITEEEFRKALKKLNIYTSYRETGLAKKGLRHKGKKVGEVEYIGEDQYQLTFFEKGFEEQLDGGDIRT